MTTPLTEHLNRPFKIRNHTINNRLSLAPMAGLGHIALRELIGEYGGFGLLFTGMCSAKALPTESPKVSHVFSWREEELPHLVCQIFGATPKEMAAAARRVEKEGFFGVDLNFGCSVAAICKKGCGAQLLKTPDQCIDIVKAVRDAVSIPLFVKFRTGWQPDADFAARMARHFEQAGADALTFHPRVAPDRRSRPPKWEVIARVKDAVTIPVFGNGNLVTEGDAKRMLTQTNCDGLAVGRMAVARPWIFSEWSSGFAPPPDIYLTCAMKMTEILSRHFNDYFSVKFFKKLAPYFCANFKFGHDILKRLMMSETMDDVRFNLESILSAKPEVLSRPNQNLFL